MVVHVWSCVSAVRCDFPRCLVVSEIHLREVLVVALYVVVPVLETIDVLPGVSTTGIHNFQISVETQCVRTLSNGRQPFVVVVHMIHAYCLAVRCVQSTGERFVAFNCTIRLLSTARTTAIVLFTQKIATRTT